MTVQTNHKAIFQAKYLLFKWNLQFDRAEKYLQQFALVILAFSLTACGLVICNPGYEENYGFPALITIEIYFSVFLFAFFSEIDFTDLKMIYSIQVPIASPIPFLVIFLACCHYFLAGTTVVSYALLSLYTNICILFIAFIVTVVQLHEVHMSGILLFAVQYITIIELYGFAWLGNLMKELILSGEMPL